MGTTYRALRVIENADGSFSRKIEILDTNNLPKNDLLIRVHYSGLNYKDALSAYGNKGVTRKYPHTPGIDAAGVVKECSGGKFKPGDKVIAGGFDLGMNTDGGFGEFIRIPSEWAAPLPQGMSLRESMILGGKGFTAGLCVWNLLKQGMKPSDGPVLVTGAAGGVGSWSVLLLKKLGFYVIAGTSSLEDSKELIKKIGADEHVDKSVIDDQSGKALLKWKWAGAIENVGGNVLATALKACKYGGTVTACGNIYSHELNMTVYPFILNAVKLIGISAQETPLAIRNEVWHKLSGEWKIQVPDIVNEIGLEELPAALEVAHARKNRGQVLLAHSQE
jgi:acrylyl-CoA reductase (NADPH)